jgi:hypothetical protein
MLRHFALRILALRSPGLRRFAMRALVVRLLALQMAAAATLAATVAAQEQAKVKELPDAPVPKQQSAPQQREGAIHSTVGVLGRRSIFFPDIAASPGPLSPFQKFEIFAGQSIAPSRLLSSAFSAGISQADDSLSGYGQGMSGYGKRFGSSLATAASDHFFGTFLLASMLHDDPRYFVTGHGGVGHRVAYSLSRLVVTRTDRGTLAVNWPRLIGPLAAEVLANSYLPAKEQTGGKTAQRFGVRIGFIEAGNLAKEYWPTIFRSLRFTRLVPAPQTNPVEPSRPAPAGTPVKPSASE